MINQGDKMKENNNKSLHNPTLRVINILEAIEKSLDGLTLSEISEKTSTPKSTISPIIYTLLSKDYISLDKNTSRYKIGMKSFLLGLSYKSNSSSIEIIKKEMEDVVKACNEVCQLGILIDYDVFYLAKVDSEQPINLVSSVGKKLPAYATALGKALLSGYSDEKIKNYYLDKMKAINNKTITDINVLLQQIDDIRKGELAYEFEEINKDTGCFAVPLRKNNKVIASVSVSFPLYRASEEKLELIKKVLQEKRVVLEQLINQLDLEF